MPPSRLAFSRSLRKASSRRLAVDVDRFERKELREALETRSRERHEIVERGRVGMHVYDGHAPPVVAEEGAVGKHPALSVADVGGEFLDRPLQFRERAVAYVRLST